MNGQWIRKFDRTIANVMNKMVDGYRGEWIE